MDPVTANNFSRDFSAAQAAVKAGVVPSRSRAALAHWHIWTAFCEKHSVDPTLQEFNDPIPFLQVFAHRYRSGTIAARGQQVRARTVEDALRNVGQTFASVGAAD